MAAGYDKFAKVEIPVYSHLAPQSAAIAGLRKARKFVKPT